MSNSSGLVIEPHMGSYLLHYVPSVSIEVSGGTLEARDDSAFDSDSTPRSVERLKEGVRVSDHEQSRDARRVAVGSICRIV
jgi:hypothetical protein